MALLLAVLLGWKVALGVLGAAALVWFLLATFVASRWPALHPTLNKLRTGPGRVAVVGMVAALALGAAFLSRSASACDRTERERERVRYRVRNPDRRLVIHTGPDHQVVIHSLGQLDGLPELAMLHVTARDHDGYDPESAEEIEEARREAEEARREAMEDAREAAREAAEEAEEARREAEEEARERIEEARERARERAEEMRERARERMEEARERAREASRQQMERAREIIERMNDEMERARDEMEGEHDDGHSDSRLEALLERQAERVEQLGQAVAEQLRGLAERFHDDDEDHDAADSIDL